MELIRVDRGELILDDGVSKQIAEFERQVKAIKEAEEKLKDMILAEMEDKGILKVETDDVLISYVGPTDRETFDSKAFRKDHGDLYDEYIRMTPVKSSIRIKVR